MHKRGENWAMTIEKLRKRDGRLVDFDKSKIAVAITKAFEATYKPGQVNYNIANNLSYKALKVADQYNWTLKFPFTASSINTYLRSDIVPAGPSGNGAYPH